MSDAATRGRKIRARDAAMRELVKQSCYVWDVSRPGGQTKLVAYNHDVPVLREIYVCLDPMSMKSAGRLVHRRGVSLEIWHRNAGEVNFRIMKP